MEEKKKQLNFQVALLIRFFKDYVMYLFCPTLQYKVYQNMYRNISSQKENHSSETKI